MSRLKSPIILASTSFRRQELLRWLGLPYQVVEPDFDELAVKFSDFQDPQSYVQTIAVGKNLSVKNFHPSSIIISADTIVFFGGRVFGKPEGIDGAREMLKLLRGNSHQVLTGLVVSNQEKMLASTVLSEVFIDDISNARLEKYLATSESLGKAGSYSIAGEAKEFVHLRQGTLTNVSGLPLEELVKIFSKFHITVPVQVESIMSQYLS